MGFNTIGYLVFLPIVFLIYWRLPYSIQNIFLLISSYIFYALWNIKYTVLIVTITVIAFFSALIIEKREGKLKKAILMITLTTLLCILFYYKYLTFVLRTAASISERCSVFTNKYVDYIVLPVGISFYTFQAIGYVVDVYKEELKAEKNFCCFALFISFFPQLVAGPIERASHLLEQIKKKRCFNESTAYTGLKIILIGYVKKIVVADSLAVYADKVFDNPRNYQGFSIIIATICFTFQIYCDFAGYSDIAIGSASLFGIDLMKNFNSPYLSRSLRDFWNRWHISLSKWFQDYLYIPLGGNREGEVKRDVNVFITFMLSGLWHGAGINYIVWGGMHGLARILENIANKVFKKKHGNVLIVFGFCSFAWIAFRAETMSDFCYLISNMFSGINNPLLYIKTGIASVELDVALLLKVIAIILGVVIYDFINYHNIEVGKNLRISKGIKYLLYYVAVFLVMKFWWDNAGENQFVYFQF